ncbi:MAG: OadG family protein [Verrucomicrobiota bacterium]
MSLINQALRKAQHDRNPNQASGGAPTTPAQLAAATDRGRGPVLIIGLAIAFAILIALVAVLSLILFSRNEPEPTPVIASKQVPVLTPEPAPDTLQNQPQPTTSQTSSPLTREDPSDVVEQLRLEREAVEKAAATAAAEPNPEIIDWLARAVISGVKLSGTGSKVILNGNSYSIGEYANATLGLKVMIIQEERVLFVDSNGKKYLKRL